MKDAMLHILLGLVLAAKNAALLLAVGVTPQIAATAGLFIAAWEIFLREVSQIQEDIDSPRWKILTGWDFWNWKSGKNIETWVPVCVLLAIGIAL